MQEKSDSPSRHALGLQYRGIRSHISDHLGLYHRLSHDVNVVHLKGGGFAVPNDLPGSAGLNWQDVMESAFFAPRARQSLGAYRIPRETGILIPSDF